jgi:phosphohistidine swiveling domain-containing protein
MPLWMKQVIVIHKMDTSVYQAMVDYNAIQPQGINVSLTHSIICLKRLDVLPMITILAMLIKDNCVITLDPINGVTFRLQI